MATKVWTGNALPIAQIQTYSPGQQLPNTVITATINGKSATYTSPTGTNDDLIAGLIAAIGLIVQYAPEFAEIQFKATSNVPSVPAPNATFLQMSSKTPGVPFTVTIGLSGPPTIAVTRVTAGQAAVNELQQITIGPNAESGSSFTITWGGHTTSAIPTPPSMPTTAAGSSGVLSGAYLWAVTFVTATGETELGLPSASLTLAAQQGSLTNIPLGPSSTTKRRVYRTKAGGTVFFLVGTIADNTTTTYTDNNTDATIGVNPGPPATNGVLQGELEALTGVGEGNVKVGGAGAAAYAGMTMPSSPIVYEIQFTGALGGASQSLVSGSVANVTILPTVSLAATQAGAPPQNAIHSVGWKQIAGINVPTGSFTITLPGLGVTTAPILFNASAATVQAALIAAAGASYAAAFTVTLTQLTASGGATGAQGYLWQIAYQGPLTHTAVPLATIGTSGLVAAAGDTITGYQTQTQAGTPTGFNAIETVTLNNAPTGGTFGITGTLANGNTISATGVSYNASAATLLAAFPAGTVNVSGSAGGPYTVEAIGQAGTQAVTWTATSSLTATAPPSGSPPGSNTAGIDPPFVGYTTGAAGGALSSGTWHYKVTAVNGSGETIGTDLAIAVTGPTAYVAFTWTAVPTATSYNIYRGSTAGATENLKLANVTATAYTDYGGTATSQSPPGSNGTAIVAPTGLAVQTAQQYDPDSAFNVGNPGGYYYPSGSLTAGTTYYYKVTATNSTGETTPSSEVSFTPVTNTSTAGAQDTCGTTCPLLTWTAVTGATGYKIYRGTTAGSENVLVGTLNSGSVASFMDTGSPNTSATPPTTSTSSYGTGIGAGIFNSPLAETYWGSGLAAGTYYYKITGTDNLGRESVASSEVSVTVAAGQSALLYFGGAAYYGGTQTFRIYRGTSPGGENVIVAQFNNNTPGTMPGDGFKYIDAGATATSAALPGSNTTALSTPTQNATGIVTTGGAFSSATYYYKVTALNSSGETTASGEQSAAPTSDQIVTVNWSAVAGATGYNIYRGTSSGSENKLVGTVNSGSAISFNDSDPVNTSATPPSSNGATIAAPTQTVPSTSSSGGALASNTYYYKVTAYTVAGETTASNEESIGVTGPTGEVTLNWNAVTGADGYKVYRGTSSNGENVLVGIAAGGSTTSFLDVGNAFASFAAVELTAGAAGINEQQLVTLNGATGGTFLLAFEGSATGNLSYTVSAAGVQTALQGIVGGGNMTVSGSNGGPYTVTAAGTLAGTPLPLIAANGKGLAGTTNTGQSLTTAQAASGPNFWDNANNWSPTGVPANGDSVYFQNSTVDCLYNLAQSSTTLANLQIDLSYVGGEIGLPAWNGKYYEYRQQYLQIGVSGTILIGSGKGSGPTLIKLDTGTNATNMLINGCGTSLDPTLPAILWKGNRASGTSTITIAKGSIGIAVYAGETATVDVINQGYVTNVNSDSTVVVGAGATIATQWYMTGGTGTLNASCPLLTIENGNATILDGIASTSVTTLNVVGGTVSDRSTGAISTLSVGTGATYDRSDDSRSKTIAGATIFGKATLLDPNDTITFTSPLTLSDCSLLDVTLDLGTNITLSRLAVGQTAAGVIQSNQICQGRLTLTSNTPVPTNDVTGATTLYFAPFRGNVVSLYNTVTSAWQNYQLASQLSLSLSGLTASLPYDVFLSASGSTLTLTALAWTNATTRATALALQNGIYVKSGSPGSLYLGTFYTTGTGTTEDSMLRRYVWNYYNRVKRPMNRFETTSSWTYTNSTFRQANGSTSNQLQAVVGVAEAVFDGSLSCVVSNSVASTIDIAIGTNSTTTPDTNFLGGYGSINTGGYVDQAYGSLRMIPAAGYNYWAWLERVGGTSPTGTFYGTQGSPPNWGSGITGTIDG